MTVVFSTPEVTAGTAYMIAVDGTVTGDDVGGLVIGRNRRGRTG